MRHAGHHRTRPPHRTPTHPETYEQEYSDWERDFLVEAREHGLDSTTVRDLRDAGIRLAIEADGRRVTDEAMDAFAKKFKGRLKPTQIASIRAWWRGSIEGGGPS